MYLIPFVMEQTLNWRLDKEKEVHGVSVHLLMIDRLVSSCSFLNKAFYLQPHMLENRLGKVNNFRLVENNQNNNLI